MGTNFRHVAFVGLCMVMLAWRTAPARGASPADGVAAALAEVNLWLEGDAGAEAWHKFLKSSELKAELAKGSAADKQVVKQILDVYSGKTPGLDRTRFVAVRKALESWHVELSLPTVADLPAAARAAAAQFAPVPADRSTKAKAKLTAALGTLEKWLAASGEKTSAGWKTHLSWDELKTQLADDATPDAKALDAIISKYRANEKGLELARFTAARDALREYARAVELGSEDKLKETYPKQLEELALRLEAFAKDGPGEDAAAAGRIVGWLEQAGQAPTIVSGVRRNFSRPNLLAHVSAGFIDAAVTEDVNDTTPIAEFILKTEMYGTAYTRGRINSVLVPSTGNASLDIVLQANTFSNNIGYQGPVTIHSDGNTSTYARKRIFITADGLTSSPAVASCQTASNIHGIDAPLRIIEKLAWKKAGKSQSQAEAIASGKAEARVAAQMDRRVADLVVTANEAFVDKFKKPLLRRGEFPSQVALATLQDRLTIRVQQMNALQLAATDAPPELSGGQDLAVRVHESLVSNFAEAAIGGETLTDKRLADMLLEATGNVPEELQLSPDKDPWSITFHAVRPVSVAFSGQEVKIAIRGQRFTRGENAIKEPMSITAVYKIERNGNGAKFVRQGDVVADYVEKPARLSITQVAFKTFMRRKFNALFKEEIDRGQDGLTLPGRMEKVGTLPLDVLTADKGWFVAAWKLPPKTAPRRPLPGKS